MAEIGLGAHAGSHALKRNERWWFFTLLEKPSFTTNVRGRIAAALSIREMCPCIFCPFKSAYSQRIPDVFSVLSISSRFRNGMLSCRLSQVCSLAAILSLLLPGLVLAQVYASSETDFGRNEDGRRV